MADDVPLELSGPVGMLTESDDLFEAVGEAMEHNDSVEAQRRGGWAVVVEPGGIGRIWPAARLCTPDHLQSDGHLVARRLGTALSAGHAELRLAGPGAGPAASGSPIPRRKPWC